MSEQITVKCRSGQAGSGAGLLWFGGWLFTIGYLKLVFWQGVIAIVIWPYYLGVFFHRG